MLDEKTLDKFSGKANQAHQLFLVWMYTNNEVFKHQNRWNKIGSDIGPFTTEEFTRRHGSKYKNFWGVTLPALQHAWGLEISKLFDPAYHPRDVKRTMPRLSLAYVLLELNNENFSTLINSELNTHLPLIASLKTYRNNVFAHNDLNFQPTQIKGGVEDLFDWLDGVILRIKKLDRSLVHCNQLNLEYTDKLSKCGVEEIFENLLLGEKYE